MARRRVRKEKRESLFTKYAFEIGVVTLPAYLVLLLVGLVYLNQRIGVALAVLGVVGLVSSAYSMVNGFKDIKW